MTLAETQSELLKQFMVETPFQPATNLWRCIELPVLAAALPREGLGLDIGCGDGTLTGILARLAGARWNLVGIDPDPAETALAERFGKYQSRHTCGAASLPEPDLRFDFAFANSVLEHIPEPVPALAEIGRVLKRGGRFAATVPSPHLHDCLAGPGLFDAPMRAAYLADLDDRLAHHYYWSAERWCDELRRAGLEPEPPQPYLCRPQVRRWEMLANWTGGLVHKLSGKKPVAVQHSLGLRRGMPGALKGMAGPMARFAGAGILGRKDSDPARNGCWLICAAKP
jgi:SAM-dependent methyltransferase